MYKETFIESKMYKETFIERKIVNLNMTKNE